MIIVLVYIPAINYNKYVIFTGKQDLKVTLWRSLADRFDVEAIHKLPPPVVIVFTSTKIMHYGMIHLTSTDMFYGCVTVAFFF